MYIRPVIYRTVYIQYGQKWHDNLVDLSTILYFREASHLCVKLFAKELAFIACVRRPWTCHNTTAGIENMNAGIILDSLVRLLERVFLDLIRLL